MGHAASSPDIGTEHPPGVVSATELRLIDAAIGFFQRLRNRVAPPVDAEAADHGGRRRSPAHGAAAGDAAPAAVAAPVPGRLRSFLLHVAFLLVGTIAGMTFSYRILSQVIDANDIIVDYLRDQIAQMTKEEARNLNARAKLQLQVAENNKEIREFRVVIDEYKDLVEDLRQQLSELKAVRAGTPARTIAPYATSPAKSKPSGQTKLGTCVMGSGSTAASLANCVDEFNRK